MKRFLITLLFLLPACEAGNKIPDAESSDVIEEVTVEETQTPEKKEITGCAWLAGSWTFVDCLGDSLQLDFYASTQCTFQIVTTSTLFAGAWAKVNNAGMSIFLPAANGSCHGAFDGTTITGACDTLTGPCSFEAQPK